MNICLWKGINMKKIKILIILVLVIVLTGCSGTYNLKINEDLSIDESIDLTLPIKDGLYDNTLRLFENNKIPKEDYKVTASEKDVKIKYKTRYDSFEEYVLESKLYRSLFSDINYTKDKKTLNIDTTSVFKLDNSPSTNVVNDFDISLLQIKIDTPYKILSTNADNKEDNIMIWSLNKNTSKKRINFSLNIDKKTTAYVQIIVLSLIGIIIIASVVFVLKRIKIGSKV